MRVYLAGPPRSDSADGDRAVPVQDEFPPRNDVEILGGIALGKQVDVLIAGPEQAVAQVLTLYISPGNQHVQMIQDCRPLRDGLDLAEGVAAEGNQAHR